jgi:hypothetical protein
VGAGHVGEPAALEPVSLIECLLGRRRIGVLRWSSSCRHHTVSGSNTLVGAGPRSTDTSICTGLNSEVHGAEVAVAQ